MNLLNQVNEWIQKGFEIRYLVLNQIENGYKEEVDAGRMPLYTYSFVIDKDGEELWSHSVDSITDGYNMALVFLAKNYPAVFGDIMKFYKEIDPPLGFSIDDAVQELLHYRHKGELVFMVFNGIPLYSDSVTLDTAYIQITGKNKAEFIFDTKERERNRLLTKQMRQANMQDLIEHWRKRGREVLLSDKIKEWDKIVPIRLNDIYEGMELGACLEIVTILNNDGMFEEANQVLENQYHSGASYALVCSMIKLFADRGDEFLKYILRQERKKK